MSSQGDEDTRLRGSSINITTQMQPRGLVVSSYSINRMIEQILLKCAITLTHGQDRETHEPAGTHNEQEVINNRLII